MIHYQGGGKMSKMERTGKMRVLGDAENAHPGRKWKDARFQGGRKVIIVLMINFVGGFK